MITYFTKRFTTLLVFWNYIFFFTRMLSYRNIKEANDLVVEEVTVLQKHGVMQQLKSKTIIAKVKDTGNSLYFCSLRELEHKDILYVTR